MKKIIILLAVVTLFSCTKETIINRPCDYEEIKYDTIIIKPVWNVIDSIGFINNEFLTFDSEYYNKLDNKFYIPIEHNDTLIVNYFSYKTDTCCYFLADIKTENNTYTFKQFFHCENFYIEIIN